MGTFYLVRHGQASLGADDYDRLSPLGQRQSVRLGEHLAARGLRFDAYVSGTLRRHHQTLTGLLQGMGAEATPTISDAAFNEYDFDAVIAAVHPAPRPRPVTPEAVRLHFRLLREGLAAWMAGTLTPEGMPRFADFRGSIVQALARLRDRHPAGNILIVSSGGTIATAIGHVLAATAATTIELNLRMRNTSVSEITFTPRHFSLLSFNSVAHLESAALAEAITLS